MTTNFNMVMLFMMASLKKDCLDKKIKIKDEKR